MNTTFLRAVSSGLRTMRRTSLPQNNFDSTLVYGYPAGSWVTLRTAYRVLPQRWASSTWYSGPKARLGEAVAWAYRASAALAGFMVMGLPLEEHYASCQILTEDRIEALRILIPLMPKGPSE